MLSNRSCCGSRQTGMMGFGGQMPYMGGQMGYGAPIMEGQVIEPTITKCVEQEFYHEVPQVW